MLWDGLSASLSISTSPNRQLNRSPRSRQSPRINPINPPLHKIQHKNNIIPKREHPLQPWQIDHEYEDIIDYCVDESVD